MKLIESQSSYRLPGVQQGLRTIKAVIFLRDTVVTIDAGPTGLFITRHSRKNYTRSSHPSSSKHRREPATLIINDIFSWEFVQPLTLLENFNAKIPPQANTRIYMKLVNNKVCDDVRAQTGHKELIIIAFFAGSVFVTKIVRTGTQKAWTVTTTQYTHPEFVLYARDEQAPAEYRIVEHPW